MKKICSYLVVLAVLFTMLRVVSFAVPDVPLEGDGTQESPLLITSSDDFFEFAESFYNDESYSDTYVLLTDDITTDYPYPMASAGTAFEGVFDGNGKTITFTDAEFTGFFGEISGATVKNITVVGNISVNDTQYDTIGGIVGKAYNNSVISNCVFNGAVSNDKIGSNNFAGICAMASDGITIENCKNYADVASAGSYSAGILGYATGDTVSISDCNNYGDISGDTYVAGIIGNVYDAGLNLNHCVNAGNIAAGAYAGGIVNFYAQSTSSAINITNCINRGVVSSSTNNGYSAGIVSYSVSSSANVRIYNCANYGDVFGNSRKGGIMAYWSGRGRISFTMKNCLNCGTIADGSNGALISYYDGSTIDDISGNYYDSTKCATPFAIVTDVRPSSVAVANNVENTMVENFNNYITEQGKSSSWLTWTVGYVDEDGIAHKNPGSNYTPQIVFEQDIVTDDSPNGAASVLSEGSLWIIIIVAVAAIASVAVLVLLRKKKNEVAA